MKKIIGYMIVLAVLGMFAINAAAAIDMQTHDFDGHFKMSVPKGASIKQVSDTYDEGVVYKDSKDNINISYTDTNDYAGKFASFTALSGTKMYKSGDYSISESPDGVNRVTFMDDSHMIQISGKMPVDQMKSMLDTVKVS